LQPELRRLRGPKLTFAAWKIVSWKVVFERKPLRKYPTPFLRAQTVCMFVCLYVCMFVCLCPINIKIAEVFGPIFCTILLQMEKIFDKWKIKKVKKKCWLKYFWKSIIALEKYGRFLVQKWQLES